MKSHLSITYFAVTQSFWKFAQDTAAILPCPVQNDWTIETDDIDDRDFARLEFRSFLYPARRPVMHWDGHPSGYPNFNVSRAEFVGGIINMSFHLVYFSHPEMAQVAEILPDPWFLTAPRHYINQCWPVLCETIVWHICMWFRSLFTEHRSGLCFITIYFFSPQE